MVLRLPIWLHRIGFYRIWALTRNFNSKKTMTIWNIGVPENALGTALVMRLYAYKEYYTRGSFYETTFCFIANIYALFCYMVYRESTRELYLQYPENWVTKNLLILFLYFWSLNSYLRDIRHVNIHVKTFLHVGKIAKLWNNRIRFYVKTLCRGN